MEQKRKSILNRIERAQRGIPTVGKVPYGREWNVKEQRWELDEAKRADIERIAQRYLDGESMPLLAKEYGFNHSNLTKILRHVAGDTWTLSFVDKSLNINETVTLTGLPRLLDDRTIKAVKQRFVANRTYGHGRPKHDYLLSGMVFCNECGYAYFGDTKKGIAYYRHNHHEVKTRCPLPTSPWIRADVLEQSVVGKLFDMFGNPSQIVEAVQAAIPDCEQATKDQQRLAGRLDGVKRSRDRFLSLVRKGAIDMADAEKQLSDLKDEERELLAKLDNLTDQLADIPSEDAVKGYVERIGESICVFDRCGNDLPGGNDLVGHPSSFDG
jgi:hypothetical protein